MLVLANNQSRLDFVVSLADKNTVQTNKVYLAKEKIRGYFLSTFYGIQLFVLLAFLRGLLNVVNRLSLKEIKNFKKDTSKYSYDYFKNKYNIISSLLLNLELLVNKLMPYKDEKLLSSTFESLKKTTNYLKEYTSLLSSVIHVEKLENNYEDYEKDLKSLQSLADVWGEDDDDVYDKSTHSNLVKTI